MVASGPALCYIGQTHKEVGEIMAISQELLDILVCPLCKVPVSLKDDKSGLKCGKCHRVYPIQDDIPVMLIDEAKIEPA